jgi:Co/Zn/Cd efflux system component
MKLSEIPSIEHLEFDIPNRKLKVFHSGELERIKSSIDELNLDSRLVQTGDTSQSEFEKNKIQKTILWTVLAINFAFFLIEMTTGWIAKSMGLVADSLDMLADSLVYGLSLFAVGAAVARKKRIAIIAGYFQITLAAFGFLEIIRRFIGVEQMPEFKTMIIVSALALLANGICLYLLQKSKSKEAHMQASMIFTSNDVIINLGVIIAGILVYSLNSKYPDLIIGAIVFIFVSQGARRILKLGQ